MSSKPWPEIAQLRRLVGDVVTEGDASGVDKRLRAAAEGAEELFVLLAGAEIEEVRLYREDGLMKHHVLGPPRSFEGPALLSRATALELLSRRESMSPGLYLREFEYGGDQARFTVSVPAEERRVTLVRLFLRRPAVERRVSGEGFRSPVSSVEADGRSALLFLARVFRWYPPPASWSRELMYVERSLRSLGPPGRAVPKADSIRKSYKAEAERLEERPIAEPPRISVRELESLLQMKKPPKVAIAPLIAGVLLRRGEGSEHPRFDGRAGDDPAAFEAWCKLARDLTNPD